MFNGTSAQEGYECQESFNIENVVGKIGQLGKLKKARHRNGTKLKTIDVKFDDHIQRWNPKSSIKSLMQSGVTWLNKSNTLMTVK